jgi:hypothetical protein
MRCFAASAAIALASQVNSGVIVHDQATGFGVGPGGKCALEIRRSADVDRLQFQRLGGDRV